ncbi:MAG: 30S ribosomal protein S1 [Acidobacteria bacterium]|nr:30S ribosomal protein S1 [Acidobacteriota bacterium]
MATEVNKAAEETENGTAAAKEVAETAKAEAAMETADEALGSNDIDFGAILEQFEQDQVTYHSGDIVEGKVVGVSDHGVLVDFGYKSEGIIPGDEFPDGPDSVKVGDVVEVMIRNISTGDAPPLLSRDDAANRKVWADIEEAYKNEQPIVGKIVSKTKGGLNVDLGGVEAFLPGSQIDSRPVGNLDAYIGQDIEAQIIKFSRKRNNIVLSRKVITDQVINEQKAETLGVIEVGHVIEGTVKNLTEYGAFVDIGGIDGLLHVTDMSWGRIQNPGEMFKPGDNIQVKVIKLDREKEKISLGYKQLHPDPWSTVVEFYPVNTKLTGKVSSVADYGIFVELQPGVEGLVHVSEISWSKRPGSPKKLFRRGDEVEVQVLGVDTDERRISLGMKQMQDNPWDSVAARFPVGTKIRGKVRNLTDFGAFVEVEDGIDGLVHISDITWGRKLQHPKELLKKDQEVDAIVTNIDIAGQRLSLSMKDLTPSSWESFIATHKPGDTIRGKVSRFTNFGIFVELGEGLEGLCHISEISDERVEKAEDVVQIGQEMDFKILRIENEEQKIGLSHRSVGKDDEPIVDTRQYTSVAKGGMASLGELANLKFGSAAQQPAEEKKADKKADKKAEPAAEEKVEQPAPEPSAEEAAEEPVAETAETVEAPAEEVSETQTEEATSEVKADEAVAEATAAEETAEVAEAAAEETVEPAAEAETPIEAESSNEEAAEETTA